MVSSLIHHRSTGSNQDITGWCTLGPLVQERDEQVSITNKMSEQFIPELRRIVADSTCSGAERNNVSSFFFLQGSPKGHRGTGLTQDPVGIQSKASEAVFVPTVKG